jgi:hypothetical protein
MSLHALNFAMHCKVTLAGSELKRRSKLANALASFTDCQTECGQEVNQPPAPQRRVDVK